MKRPCSKMRRGERTEIGKKSLRTGVTEREPSSEQPLRRGRGSATRSGCA